MEQDTVRAELIMWGPWGIPIKVTNCLCPDGRRRTVYTAQEADTFFSLPARVKFKGKTVAGFVSQEECGGELRFHPYTYRKNGHLFEEGN